MKAFVAVALAAAAQAAPEADPQVLLAQPLVYGNAHTQVHAQVKHANGAVVPDDTLSVKAAKVQHLAAKATAYLNKPLVYTHPVVQTVAAPLVHQTVASPVVSYTGAYPHVYGTHFIKREAEAEAEAQPEAEADPALLVHPYTAGVVPHVYNGVYGAHVTAPVTYTHGLTTPVVSTVAKTVVPTTVVKPVVSSVYNYGLHTPLTYNYNTHFIKREAEAEAEADHHFVNPYTGVYSGVHHVAQPVTYTTGLTHHVPYVAKTVVPTTVVKPVVSSVYNYGLHTPLVNTHFIKREAEAEADPALLVNSYTGVYSGIHQVAQPVTYTNGLTHHVPYVAKTVVPTTVVKPVVSSVYNYGLHTPLTYNYNTHFIKREAEADPEAIFYGNYGNGVPAYTTSYTGYTTGHAPNYAYNPVYGYNNYGYAYGK